MKTSLYRTYNGWVYRAQYRGETVEGWSVSRDAAKACLGMAVQLAFRQAVAS